MPTAAPSPVSSSRSTMNGPSTPSSAMMMSAVNGTYRPWSSRRGHWAARTAATTAAPSASALPGKAVAATAMPTPRRTAAIWRNAVSSDQWTVGRTMTSATHAAR